MTSVQLSTSHLILVFSLIIGSCYGEFWFEDDLMTGNLKKLGDVLTAAQLKSQYIPNTRFDTFGFNETLTDANIFMKIKLSDKLFKVTSTVCPVANSLLLSIMQDISAYTYSRRLQPKGYKGSSDYFNYGIKLMIKLLEQCERYPPPGNDQTIWFFDKPIIQYFNSKVYKTGIKMIDDIDKCSDIRQWFDTNANGKKITLPGRMAFENLWGSYLVTYFACSSIRPTTGEATLRFYDLIENVMLSPFMPIWTNPDLPIRRALHVFQQIDDMHWIPKERFRNEPLKNKMESAENYPKLTACAKQQYYRTNATHYPCFNLHIDTTPREITLSPTVRYLRRNTDLYNPMNSANRTLADLDRSLNPVDASNLSLSSIKSAENENLLTKSSTNSSKPSEAEQQLTEIKPTNGPKLISNETPLYIDVLHPIEVINSDQKHSEGGKEIVSESENDISQISGSEKESLLSSDSKKDNEIPLSTDLDSRSPQTIDSEDEDVETSEVQGDDSNEVQIM